LNSKQNIEEEIKKFKFLNIIRISIFFSLLFVSLLILAFVDSKIKILPIILIISSATIISLLNFYLLKLYSIRFNVYIQLLSDIIFITIMVYLTGGITSPFYFLYILPIIISSIFLKRRDTILTASISFIFFGVISEMMYMGIIPSELNEYQNTISISSFIYNLTMSFIAFLSVSITASFYFMKMKSTGEELQAIKDNFESLALLNHTVIGKMNHGFITADNTGKIISYNKIAQSYINFNKNDNILDILKIEKENYNEKDSFEKNINNRTLNISLSLVSNISDFKIILVFLISDLTEKRKTEKKLKEQEHLALIGEMAAGIAHEIRNPLASISGSVQFLKDNIDLQEENKNLMDIIVKESNRLSNSIEEFLDFTKSVPIVKTKFNLSTLIDETILLLENTTDNIRFIKRYNDKVMLYADEKKIKQAFWNLISNSIKAIEDEGYIEITIIEDKNITLIIKDNGIGINENDLKKIYTPFYSKFTSGIGLGMPIVKRIIEEHNAEINIISRKNFGTEIIITFGDSNE